MTAAMIQVTTATLFVSLNLFYYQLYPQSYCNLVEHFLLIMGAAMRHHIKATFNGDLGFAKRTELLTPCASCSSARSFMFAISVVLSHIEIIGICNMLQR